jgi:hypothetical protein
MFSHDGTRPAIHCNPMKMFGLVLRPETGLVRLEKRGNNR